jgi:Protein of unknown function (DUF3592)
VDPAEIAIFSMVFGALAIFAFLSWRKRVAAEEALQWPQTEATVESGAIETVGSTGHNTVALPTFRFSYKVAGEYYAGRFSLRPVESDPPESLLLRMVHRKLQVHYDPGRPEVWFLHDKMIEGCKVEQKMNPEVGYAPE